MHEYAENIQKDCIKEGIAVIKYSNPVTLLFYSLAEYRRINNSHKCKIENAKCKIKGMALPLLEDIIFSFAVADFSLR
ncbi:MAG: hypothetical protein IJA31_12050 [Clostridia bacterium]|nr:hypothetical protein [Clostridia bacterium]